MSEQTATYELQDTPPPAAAHLRPLAPVAVAPPKRVPLRERTSRGGRALWHLDCFAKRLFDMTIAAILLLILSPVIAVIAVLIKVDSPGPVFFRVDRVGFRGRPLRMLKFRKMYDGAAGISLTTAADDRLTRVGKWLTWSKLDEVPQLWHVLKGDMSLVGPRPECQDIVELFPEEFSAIHIVRPGITGWSQIAFAEEGRILDDSNPLHHYLRRILPQKLALDRLYGERRSILLDARILFWTFATVIVRRPVSVHRDSGRMNIRRR